MGQLDPVVADALNRQITNERQNNAIYQAIANRFDVLNLTGMAHYARQNAKEESHHAKWFTEYLIDRNGAPTIDPLDGVNPPQADMTSAARILFSAILLREQQVTEQIKTIYSLADEADDPQTCKFLHWFLKEQTKSEREFTELVARATLAEGCAAAILALDKELGGA